MATYNIQVYIDMDTGEGLVLDTDYNSLPAEVSPSLRPAMLSNMGRNLVIIDLSSLQYLMTLNTAAGLARIVQQLFMWTHVAAPATGGGATTTTPVGAQITTTTTGTGIPQTAAVMPSPIMLGGGLLALARRAGILQKVYQYARKYKLVIGGILAFEIVDRILGGDPVEQEIGRALGIGTNWSLGAQPEIPGEEIVKVWDTGTAFYCSTRLGNYYVLTKNKGWKKYTPRGPIILGRRNLTPRKFVSAANSYYKVKKAMDKVFKVVKTKRKTPQLIESKGIPKNA